MESISIDKFKEIDLRVAKVLSAEKVENADKLLRLEIDLGSSTNPGQATEKRQIVSGIAEYYAPESLVGREIIVVYNLEPRTLKGLESKGMLLAASGDGFVSLLEPDKKVPPGSKIF